MDLTLPHPRCLSPLLLTLALLACGGEEGVHLVWTGEGVEAQGVSRVTDPEARLTVHTEAGLAAGHPPLAGSYRHTGGQTGATLLFTPAFPLAPGQRYIARWVADDGRIVTSPHAVPALELAPETRVTALYPGASEVPANLLRLYLHFSHPMATGGAREHLTLLRATDTGEARVPDPFVAPERELWDPERRRLTLLFDPGRLKQGVGPNAALGAVLEEGGQYRLEVGAGWRDARGAPLVEPFHWSFRVTAPDRRPLDPQRWRLNPPPAPAGALEVTFPEPLDRALLHRSFEVVGPEGTPVPGRVEITPGETAWRFHPETPWRPGEYRLWVDPVLEDPSGNRIGRSFDAPYDPQGDPAPPPEPPVLAFTVPLPP